MRPAFFTALAIAASAIALALPAASANAAVCGVAVPYPGDSASPQLIANWMGNGAVVLNIPAELPVMAALVESGLKNLNYGDADSLGYFQMRTSFWNTGEYKGYPTKPDLQLKWFTDQAAKVRLQRTAAGKPDPAADQALFGLWIANVERPAEQYRDRYQPRLEEARALIAETCPGLRPGYRAPPHFTAKTKKRQHALRTKTVSSRVRCPKSPCNVSISAVTTLPGSSRVHRLAGSIYMLEAGETEAIKLKLPADLRRALKSSLSSGDRIYARLRLRVAGADGVAAVKVVKVRLLR